MSNIIKRPESILTVSETKLSNALSQPMCKDLSPQQKEAATIALIGSVFANVNEKNPDDAVLIKIKSDLRELMDSEFKAMRVEEIRIALDYGSDNWEGHGVSSKLIKGWIRDWRQTKKLELQKSIAIKSKREKPTEEKEFTNEERKKSVTDAYGRFKEGNEVGGRVYIHLKKLGYSLPLKDSKEIFIQAKRELRAETMEIRTGMNSMYVDKRLKEINDDEELKDLKSPAVKSRCQKLAIHKIFKDCLDMEINPLDLIT
ncbi:MAG: hypothetical protein COA36_16770 [Desulfotalea sp.]|nr:MAG: hypothetical protein COA36_16770 [Desulfotalea sp.]